MIVPCPTVGILTTNFKKCQNSPGLPAPPCKGENIDRCISTSLRSRRYSRAQGGKLEIPPAQKLSILSSAHRAHGSAHTNVFALENQSERELLIMLLAGLQCSKRGIW